MSAIDVNLPSTRAATITLMVVASAVSIVRLAVPFILPDRKVRWKDAWLGAAFVFYLTLTILYLATYPVIFRIGAVADGSLGVYANLIKDAVEVLKVVFTTTMLHWFVLWSVKFSMLAFYKELLGRLSGYLRLWWGVTIFTCLSLAVNLFEFWFTCTNPEDMFIVGKCLTPAATRLSHVSLWTAFALDVTTDLMIMVLPLDLIRKARLPLRQKIGVASIFCLALICIASSAVRVREVGENMTGTSTPSITWLASWSLVEASIAMIIGCGPGIFELIKKTAAKHRSNKSSSNDQSLTGPSDARPNPSMSLPMYRKDKVTAPNIQLEVLSNSSQEHLTYQINKEHLTHQINITQSISMAHTMQARSTRTGKPLPELPALKSQYSIHCTSNDDF